MKVVVVGGSAGSIEVLMQIVPRLPEYFPYVLIFCLHRKAGDEGQLEHLIAMLTPHSVIPIEDKTQLLPNHIFTAPSDYHVLFEPDGTVALDGSEKVHFCRPSIDISFFSLAQTYATQSVGILLSGANEDGASGLEAIHAAGGITVVQRLDSAEFETMPASALKLFQPHFILTVEGLSRFLKNLV